MTAMLVSETFSSAYIFTLLLFTCTDLKSAHVELINAQMPKGLSIRRILTHGTLFMDMTAFYAQLIRCEGHCLLHFPVFSEHKTVGEKAASSSGEEKGAWRAFSVQRTSRSHPAVSMTTSGDSTSPPSTDTPSRPLRRWSLTLSWAYPMFIVFTMCAVQS